MSAWYAHDYQQQDLSFVHFDNHCDIKPDL